MQCETCVCQLSLPAGHSDQLCMSRLTSFYREGRRTSTVTSMSSCTSLTSRPNTDQISSHPTKHNEHTTCTYTVYRRRRTNSSQQSFSCLLPQHAHTSTYPVGVQVSGAALKEPQSLLSGKLTAVGKGDTQSHKNTCTYKHTRP